MPATICSQIADTFLKRRAPWWEGERRNRPWHTGTPNVTSPSCASSKPKPSNCSRVWSGRILSSQPGCKRPGAPDSPVPWNVTPPAVRKKNLISERPVVFLPANGRALAGCGYRPTGLEGIVGSARSSGKDDEGISQMNARPNIVLIHGAWAEGSCWSGVIERLQADGYHVTAPQFPLTALADDVARLRQVLDLQDGPAIVAGHSYGGQIMTALGADAPNVASLVYIAAFGLDQGESLGGLLSQGPVTPALAHLFTDKQGFG